MKLTILLLVVLVSTAFASPYYLRRQRRPNDQQKEQPSSGGSDKQGQGDKNGGKVDPDRKGKDACMKVLDDCMKDEETVVPAVSGDKATRGIEAMRRTAEELESKANCKEYQQETQERKRDEQTPASESTESTESMEEVEECVELLEQCMRPEEEEEGAAGAKRFLRLMARKQSRECKDALGLESEEEDVPTGGDVGNNQSPPEGGDGQSPTGGQGARRNELRQLLRDLYSRK